MTKDPQYPAIPSGYAEVLPCGILAPETTPDGLPTGDHFQYLYRTPIDEQFAVTGNFADAEMRGVAMTRRIPASLLDAASGPSVQSVIRQSSPGVAEFAGVRIFGNGFTYFGKVSGDRLVLSGGRDAMFESPSGERVRAAEALVRCGVPERRIPAIFKGEAEGCSA